MKKQNLPQLSNHDAWAFILSTIRYSLGRRTYMVGVVQDLFHTYKSYLDEDQIDQVYKEVQEELIRCERMGKFLGDSMDHDSWTRFVKGQKE